MIQAHQIQRAFDSASIAARGELPRLIRTLIRNSISSANLTECDFPVGDDIGQSGFDGYVCSSSNHERVPNGVSVWEIGTGKDWRAKFNDDISAAISKISGDTDPAEVTFVFVTSKRIDESARSEAISKARRQYGFADIRIYAAHQLAEWVSTCAAATSVVLESMGVPSSSIQRAESVWHEEIGYIEEVGSFYDVVTSGRSGEIQRLCDWLASEELDLAVCGQSESEVRAFLAAWVLENTKPGGTEPVFLFTADGIPFYRETTSPQVAIACCDLKHGDRKYLHEHHVRIIDVQTHDQVEIQTRTGTVCELRRIDTSELSIAWSKKHDDERLRQLVDESRGEFDSIKWLLDPASSLEQAKVDSWDNATVRILLCRCWEHDGGYEDTQAVAEFCGLTVNELSAKIAQLTRSPRLLRVSGMHGRSYETRASRIMGRLALKRRADEPLIEAFFAIVERVFRPQAQDDNGDTADRGDYFSLDRWGHRFSARFREGLAETLCQMAVEGGPETGSALSWKVERLLEKMLVSGDLETWRTVLPVLPLLAEAAPEVYLDRVEKMVDSGLATNFFRQNDAFIGSPHVDLLFSLERLAWLRPCLSQVSLLLARLASIDPGGQVSNRPSNSLLAILRPYRPMARITVEEQIQLMDQLVREHPGPMWNICMRLLQWNRGIVSLSGSYPEWRTAHEDTAVSTIRPISVEQWQDYEKSIVKQIGLLFQGSAVQIADLLELLAYERHHAPHVCQNVLQILCTHDPRCFDRQTQQSVLLLVETVNDDLQNKAEFGPRDGDLETREIDQQIIEWAKVLSESDPWITLQRLFDIAPDFRRFGKGRSNKHWKDQVEAERLEVVRELLETKDIDQVVRLGLDVCAPHTFGETLAAVIENGSEAGAVMRLLGEIRSSQDPLGSRTDQLMISFVRTHIRKNGAGASTALFDAIENPNARIIAAFAAGCDPNRSTWDWLEHISPDASREYWHYVWLRIEAVDDAKAIAGFYLKYGRFATAVECLGVYLQGVDPATLSYAECATLIETIRLVLGSNTCFSNSDISDSSGAFVLSYGLREMLKALLALGATLQEVAHFELAYLDAFAYEDDGTVALSRWISESPDALVKFVETLCRSSGEEVSVEAIASSLESRSKAYLALEHWDRVPGLSDDAVYIDRHGINHLHEFPLPATPAIRKGTIDGASLHAYVDAALQAADEIGCRERCLSELGKVFAYAPAGPDGIWPCKPVRVQIERLRSDRLETGFRIAVENRRGCHIVDPLARPELEIASRFKNWADRCVITHPRTSHTLRAIANRYQFEAEQRRRDGID